MSAWEETLTYAKNGVAPVLELYVDVELKSGLQLDDPDFDITIVGHDGGSDDRPELSTVGSDWLFSVYQGKLSLENLDLTYHDVDRIGSQGCILVSGTNAEVSIKDTTVKAECKLNYHGSVGAIRVTGGSVKVTGASHVLAGSNFDEPWDDTKIPASQAYAIYAVESTSSVEISGSTLIYGETSGISINFSASLNISGDVSVKGGKYVTSCLTATNSSNVRITGGTFNEAYLGSSSDVAIATEGSNAAYYPYNMLPDGYTYYKQSESGEYEPYNAMYERKLSGVFKVAPVERVVAMVETYGVKTYFSAADDSAESREDAFRRAWSAAQGNYSTLTLLDDVELTRQLVLTDDATNLSLTSENGAVLSFPDNSGEPYIVLDAGTLNLFSCEMNCGNRLSAGFISARGLSRLNISDGAVIKSSSCCISMENSSELNMSGGELYMDDEGSILKNVALSVGPGAKVTITGGSIKAESSANSTVLQVAGTSTRGSVTISGGIFENMGGPVAAFSDIGPGGRNLDELLAEDHGFYDGDNNIVDTSSISSIGNDSYSVSGYIRPTLAATLTCGGVIKEYSTGDGAYSSAAEAFKAAWEDAQGKTAELTLNVSLTLNETLHMDDPDTDLTLTAASGAVFTRSAQSGEAFDLSAGRLTVSGGSFEVRGGAGSDSSLRFASLEGGDLTVTGGSIYCQSSDPSGGFIYVGSGSTLEMTGGELGWRGGIYAAAGSRVKLSGDAKVTSSYGRPLHSEGADISISGNAAVRYDSSMLGNYEALYLSGGTADISGSADISATAYGFVAAINCVMGADLTVSDSAAVTAECSLPQGSSNTLYAIKLNNSSLKVTGEPSIKTVCYSSTTNSLGICATYGSKLSLGGGSITLTNPAEGSSHTIQLDNSGTVAEALTPGKSIYAGDRQLSSAELKATALGTESIRIGDPSPSAPVAAVEIDGERTEYERFSDAWEAVSGKAATLTLLRSVELDSGLTIGSGTDLTLDIAEGLALSYNNKTGGSDAFITITDGGKLRLSGGRLETDAKYCIRIYDGGSGYGRLDMSGGSVSAEGAGGAGILYAADTGLKALSISGGSVSGKGYGLLITYNGNHPGNPITLSGGSFTGDTASIACSETSTAILEDILASTNAFYKTLDDKCVELGAGQKSISDAVYVGAGESYIIGAFTEGNIKYVLEVTPDETPEGVIREKLDSNWTEAELKLSVSVSLEEGPLTVAEGRKLTFITDEGASLSSESGSIFDVRGKLTLKDCTLENDSLASAVLLNYGKDTAPELVLENCDIELDGSAGAAIFVSNTSGGSKEPSISITGGSLRAYGRYAVSMSDAVSSFKAEDVNFEGQLLLTGRDMLLEDCFIVNSSTLVSLQDAGAAFTNCTLVGGSCGIRAADGSSVSFDGGLIDPRGSYTEYGVYVDGTSELSLKGGASVFADGAGNCALCIEQGGGLDVSGSTVVSASEGAYALKIVALYGSTAQTGVALSGGSFTSGDLPAIIVGTGASPATVGELLAAGFSYYDGDTPLWETDTDRIGEGITVSVKPSPAQVTVTFDAAGGTVSPSSAQTVNQRLPSLPIPVRAGYIFDGWYTAGGERVTTSTVFTEDCVISARWRVSASLPEVYDINVVPSSGGKVTPSLTKSSAGARISLSAAPEAGYELVSLTVRDENGNRIALSGGSFTMPASDVTVTAVFAPDAMPFADVPGGAWYYDAVAYVYERGLMDGVDASLFAPGSTLTRAMLVTILWRMADEPVVNYYLPFSDVSGGTWYAEAVRWAASEGIVNGVTDTLFSPGSAVTREQFAAILYRFAESRGTGLSAGGTALSGFADSGRISAYALTPMTWAVSSGLIEGDEAGALSPQAGATRAQATAMLMRFCALN